MRESRGCAWRSSTQSSSTRSRREPRPAEVHSSEHPVGTRAFSEVRKGGLEPPRVLPHRILKARRWPSTAATAASSRRFSPPRSAAGGSAGYDPSTTGTTVRSAANPKECGGQRRSPSPRWCFAPGEDNRAHGLSLAGTAPRKLPLSTTFCCPSARPLELRWPVACGAASSHARGGDVDVGRLHGVCAPVARMPCLDSRRGGGVSPPGLDVPPRADERATLGAAGGTLSRG